MRICLFSVAAEEAEGDDEGLWGHEEKESVEQVWTSFILRVASLVFYRPEDMSTRLYGAAGAAHDGSEKMEKVCIFCSRDAAHELQMILGRRVLVPAQAWTSRVEMMLRARRRWWRGVGC